MREKISGRKDKFRFLIFLALSAGCLMVGMGAFFQSSPIKDKFFCPAGRAMLLETLVFFLWQSFFICLLGSFWKKVSWKWRSRIQVAGISLGFVIGLWCHQILLPFLVSGFWLLGLLLLGDCIFRRIRSGEENWFLRLAVGFIMGSGGWISLVCLLSAFHIGGLSRMRKLAAILILAVFLETVVEVCRGKKNGEKAGQDVRKKLEQFGGKWKESGKFTRKEGLFCGVMITMVFVQLARINLMPDYDSLHYGLRSHYILDGGHGIYENLGNINLVYTYPKGWEILTFPLSGTVTYGYQLCFNLWMALLAMVLAGGLVFRISRKRCTALFCGMVVSLIPGVMNMGITAKSDLFTLICQMLILWGAVEISQSRVRKEKISWFGVSLGACLLSFSMKPTALVFSTVLSISCLGALVFRGGFSVSKLVGEKTIMETSFRKTNGRLHQHTFLLAAVPVLLCTGAWAGTWIRTWKMTGVPTTSIFVSIWEKLGFSVKWPYVFSAIPSQGLEMGVKESVVFFLKRLLGILFAPVGEDMFHVRLAWGSSITILSLIAWLFWGKGEGRRCLNAAIGGVGLFCLFSLYLLWQVDGNYYMLFYLLTAVAGSLALENSPAFRGRRFEYGAVCQWASRTVFAVFLLVQAGIVMGTNWAGTTGFTSVKLIHSGVVNHQQERYQEKCSTGNQEIWAILSQNPETRVIAVGEHPQVLQFPCNVQSYYDVTGSGGNVRLVKTLEDFKKFLRFAKTEYIYVEAGYLEEGSRAYDVVRYLIEEGTLVQLRFEHGNMIGIVNLDGEIMADSAKEADNFYQQIEMKVPGN